MMQKDYIQLHGQLYVTNLLQLSERSEHSRADSRHVYHRFFIFVVQILVFYNDDERAFEKKDKANNL